MERSLDLPLQPDRARLTLPCFLADIAERHGELRALHFEGEDLSYRELERQARELARGLIGAGVVKGARIALLFANRPEWIVAAFGAALAGGVIVPVNTFATPAERDYILRHSDASVLLFRRQLLKRDFLEELVASHPELESHPPGRLRCADLPHLRHVFCSDLDTARGAVETGSGLVAAGSDVTDELLDAAAAQVTPIDDAIIVYTSGTTAHPKGVLHCQRTPVVQSYRFADYMALTSDERVLSAQPFFWTAGMAMTLGATLAAGGCLVLQETFEPGGALELIEKQRVTLLHTWAHQGKALTEHPDVDKRDLSSLSKLGASGGLGRRAGVQDDSWGIAASYGLSETFTLCSALPALTPPEIRRGTHGKPLPGMDMRIVDPVSGEPVGAGTHGEIAVRGVTFMRGYYKVEPELFLDGAGFFLTNDGGSIDEQGFLHWTGRLDNLIKTGGANVSPIEIENAVGGYPGLKAAVAIAVPHPTLSEVVVLCVVSTEGATLDEDAIRSFLREKLAAYKVPRCVLVFREDELAYTGNQKIQVGPLREAALRRLEELGREIDGHRYAQAADSA